MSTLGALRRIVAAIVMPAGYLFAALSGVAGLLLLLPFPSAVTSAQQDGWSV